MKILFSTLAIACMVISACKKDKTDPFVNAVPNFTEIKASDAQMTTSAIEVGSSSAPILLNGTIIVYKTNSGDYGKMKIVQLNFETDKSLVIDLVTFDAAGKVKLIKKNLKIEKEFSCDLSTGMTYSGVPKDFLWHITLDSQKIFPQGTAKFKQY